MRKTDTDTDEIWANCPGNSMRSSRGSTARIGGSALRFYESKTYGEVGTVLGISEEAARKRVERAVDKLQGMFQRRGISFTRGRSGRR